jgi:hypothetical protein
MMTLRDGLVWLVCIVVTVSLFVAAGLQMTPLNDLRKDLKIVINEPLENAPPSLAFATVAMGAFRGLVVDILWMRADKLKEEGKFFDAKQLAEWITVLQPRFASVWEFHAWNMAYNISVAIPASQPEQRWKWVKNGYELIRDKGIVHNPKSLSLYREIGRIFQHKMGGVTDDAHKYYKVQFAREIGPIVGGLGSYFFERASALPKDWDTFMADPNVAALVQAFHAADPNIPLDESFAETYFALRQSPQRFAADANALLESNVENEAFVRLDNFSRAHQLRTRWKMDVDLMREVNEKLGPIDVEDPNRVISMDWRHPDAHAIYWAYKGLKIASQDAERELDSDEVNTDRIIAHSLQNLFRYGKPYFYEIPVPIPLPSGEDSGEYAMVGQVYLRPEFRIFDRYNQAVKAIIAKHGDDRGRQVSLGNGHRNMLLNALFSFYQSGHKIKAQRIYDELRDLYKDEHPKFKLSLAEFCQRRFIEELRDGLGIQDAREQIEAILMESYRLYAIGSDQEAMGREQLAEQIHAHYMKESGDEETGRVNLPLLSRMRFLAALAFLESKLYPPYLQYNFRARVQTERPELYKLFQEMEKQMKQEGGSKEKDQAPKDDQ